MPAPEGLFAPDFADLPCSQVQQLGGGAGSVGAPVEKNHPVAFFHAKAVRLRFVLLSVDDEELVIVGNLYFVARCSGSGDCGGAQYSGEDKLAEKTHNVTL